MKHYNQPEINVICVMNNNLCEASAPEPSYQPMGQLGTMTVQGMDSF